MFCNQCEQTAKGEGCTKGGVCGKKPEEALLQDLLTQKLVELAQAAIRNRNTGSDDLNTARLIMRGLFDTVTNVNFDPARTASLISEVTARTANLNGKQGSLNASIDELVAQGEKAGLKTYPAANGDLLSLKLILLFGLRGLAAYAYHAAALGREDRVVNDFMQDGLAALADDNLDMATLIGFVMKCGEVNLRAMELLDEANTGAYGYPVPTAVPLGAKKGKAILVSGHDLLDIEALLKQTEGKGIGVYTHGEMLPAHGYPGLKKYPHFYGHYGTAWQNQIKEFSNFPGAILMTTNCIQKPGDVYSDRIFTTGPVGWPGVAHVDKEDFSPVINQALQAPGFEEDIDRGEVLTGFARTAVLGIAGKIIEAVKAGKIRHFFLVAGCDGAKPGRNYYTEFVEKVPQDCVVLTLACGKFRFFDKKLGYIGGIPRLLDSGQCNDAYSAIQIAVALSKAFNVSVNDLPLSMVLSWYEQKAVAILLTLLALGIKNIRLGPSLPAFITPNVFNFLVEKFSIKPITTPEDDLKAILG